MDEHALTGTRMLSRDPFQEEGQRFYGAGDRIRQLDELRHAGRWATPVVVVTGEEGIGKTTFFRAFASRVDPGVKTARIMGPLVAEAGALLRALCARLGVRSGFRGAADADEETMARAIARHVQELREIDRSCVIMIDDAHQLEDRAIIALLEVMELSGDDGALRLILFAEPDFVQRLERLHRKTQRVPRWHETRLTPLAPEEVSGYLAFRLSEAGWDGALPFTDSEIKTMARRSCGVPGSLNALASARLRGRALPGERHVVLPPVHALLAALIGAFLLAAWLLWPSGDVVQPQRRAVELPAPESELRRETSASQAADDVTGADPPFPVQAPRRQPAAPDEPEPAPPEPRSPATEPDEPRGRDWVLARPGERYTLQLLAASERERASAYVERQPGPERFAAFELERDGARWYLVIFGDFVDRSAAEAATRRLPDSVGDVEPWIRSFASIQGELQAR